MNNESFVVELRKHLETALDKRVTPMDANTKRDVMMAFDFASMRAIIQFNSCEEVSRAVEGYITKITEDYKRRNKL